MCHHFLVTNYRECFYNLPSLAKKKNHSILQCLKGNSGESHDFLDKLVFVLMFLNSKVDFLLKYEQKVHVCRQFMSGVSTFLLCGQ